MSRAFPHTPLRCALVGLAAPRRVCDIPVSWTSRIVLPPQLLSLMRISSLRHSLASFVFVAAGLTATLPAPSAFAQEDELSRAELSQARAKFQRGIELKQAGNWAGALSVFREVGEVRMTPQVRYHIATCEERLGKLVVALGGYELALSDSEGMQPEFVAEVEAAIAQLKARIPKLVIERGDGADAASIELDGVALGQSSIGVETVVDPGPHVVSATAPGRVKFSQTITIDEQETKTLAVVLEAVPSNEPPPPPIADTAPAPREPESKYGILPYVVGGVGATSLVTSGVFFYLNRSTVSDLEGRCPDRDCRSLGDGAWQSAQDDYDAAKVQETVAWVTGGVGLVALGAGVALYLLDQEPTQEAVATSKRGVRVVGSAPGADAGLSLHGVF